MLFKLGLTATQTDYSGLTNTEDSVKTVLDTLREVEKTGKGVKVSGTLCTEASLTLLGDAVTDIFS